MADQSDTLDSTKKPAKVGSKSSAEDILSIGRKRLNVAIAATSDSRENQLNDLRFAAGNSDNNYQWPDYAVSTRMDDNDVQARPMLTVNKLPQHIKQVTNDQRQNRPAGKVIPGDGESSVDMAEIYDGLVRHIEYQSDADVAYDTACDNQVTHGEGWWRILTDYEDEKSFDLEIYIRRIRNSFSVYIDPTIQMPSGEDADWGWILEDLTHEEFEEQYPDASPISSIESNGVGDSSYGGWLTEDTIRVGEYFYKERTRVRLFLFKDDNTAFEGTPEYDVYKRELGEPIKSRMSVFVKVCWIKTNGYEILDEKDWPGRYIPIVRVPGNEFEIDGKVFVSGIVRNAKDAQRMYNYWISQEAEMLALSPKAPFIGAAGQFEGFEDDWQTANVKAHPYLQYNSEVTDTDGRALPPPQRSMPPMVQSGLISAKQGASEDIKDATGQYNASLGQTSNERSGKAILARQHEGDVSTFHYGDNLGRAVRFSTRQLVDLIPKIYDRPGRIARIIGEDGSHGVAHLDSSQPQAVVEEKDPTNPEITIRKIYNPSVGKFDVRIVSGPGYASKRREALDAMAQLLQATPELWHIAGDIFVKNMDWPGAQDLAKRFQKSMDPKLLADENDPALQQANQQLEQLTQQYQQATSMLQNVKNSMEAKELDIHWFEAQIKWYAAQTDRMKVTEPGMNEQQVQEIAAGTVHAAMGGEPQLPPPPSAPPQQPQGAPQGGPAMPPGQAPQMPPQPAPQQPAPGGV